MNIFNCIQHNEVINKIKHIFFTTNISVGWMKTVKLIKSLSIVCLYHFGKVFFVVVFIDRYLEWTTFYLYFRSNLWTKMIFLAFATIKLATQNHFSAIHSSLFTLFEFFFSLQRPFDHICLFRLIILKPVQRMLDKIRKKKWNFYRNRFRIRRITISTLASDFYFHLLY